MRILRTTVVPLVLIAAAGAALAEEGLKVAAAQGSWYGVQAPVRFSAVVLDVKAPLLGYHMPSAWSGGYTPLAASLAGDYYFSKDLADGDAPRTGFRASSALLIRQPGVSLSELAWGSRSALSYAPARLSLPSLAIVAADPTTQSISAMPYLGLGYSDYSLKSGWGFWADIGLVVQSPGGALGMGRVLSGSQSVEDLVRELRMSPMLQLGVNYSF